MGSAQSTGNAQAERERDVVIQYDTPAPNLRKRVADDEYPGGVVHVRKKRNDGDTVRRIESATLTASGRSPSADADYPDGMAPTTKERKNGDTERRIGNATMITSARSLVTSLDLRFSQTASEKAIKVAPSELDRRYGQPDQQDPQAKTISEYPLFLEGAAFFQRLCLGLIPEAAFTHPGERTWPMPNSKQQKTERPNSEESSFEEDRHTEPGFESDGELNEELEPDQHRRLDTTAAPLSNIYAIFDHLAQKAESWGFPIACLALGEHGLRVFTMCSGTESPVLAMNLLKESFATRDMFDFKFQHLASAEIEPEKQAYIERNFHPPVIFRDVTEFSKHKKGLDQGLPPYHPHTAYGGAASPPEGVHILIAGSSCVDYSRLNRTPKAYGATGESYSTLQGISAYADAYRPNIVILENVKSAPWEQIKKHWEDLDYYAAVVILDSKNYYIPQTRQRGYMIAFDKKHAREMDFDVEKAAQKWIDLMAVFQRRASSPYTEFILGDDDPKLEHAKHALLHTTKTNDKSQDWSACRHRYLTFRNEHNLGHLRPYTKWRNNGSCQFPDFGWLAWARMQRERIWDTLEIDHLRYVSERDYDMSYKHRYIELSQNVDRDIDARHWGLVGCLTPSGMPYETMRAGPILGLESLALQGIPINDLVLATHSSRQLQDLAGNAMTTTVVGPAIFSAVIAAQPMAFRGGEWRLTGTSFFQSYAEKFAPEGFKTANTVSTHGSVQLTALSKEQLISKNGAFALIHSPEFLTSNSKNKLEKLSVVLGNAAASRQLCKCEGLMPARESKFKICTECGHISCRNCGQNPRHHYVPTSIHRRMNPADFMTAMKEILPMSLQLFPPHDTTIRAALSGLTRTLRGATESACKSIKEALQSVVHFQHVKRDQGWKVIYESDQARLELHFDPKFRTRPRNREHLMEPQSVGCRWLLFAKPAPDEFALSETRKLFVSPIARMVPEQDLLTGSWHIWGGPGTYCGVQISGKGVKIDSWEKKLGLRARVFTTLMVFPELEVKLCSNSDHPGLQRIGGTYRLLPDCGCAGGTLHRQILSESTKSEADEPMYLFMDPEPLDDAKNDRFVFSPDPRRRCDRGSRTIFAKLPPRWKPVGTGRLGLDAFNDCEDFSHWTLAEDMVLTPTPKERILEVWFPQFPASALLEPDQCVHTPWRVLVVEIPLDKSRQQRWPVGRAISIGLSEQAGAPKDFDWALKRAANKRFQDPRWHSVRFNGATSICRRCVPSAPELEWLLTRKAGSESYIVKPFESPFQAANYENDLKRVPPPVTAQVHCHASVAYLEVLLNVVTLIHRAFAQLPSEGHDESIVHPITRWRLTRYDEFDLDPEFGTFRPPNNTADPPWPFEDPIEFEECDWENWPLPTEFIRHTSRLGSEFEGTRKLWIPQRQILTWMQAQELYPQPWMETGFVEACIPALGWLFQAQASVQKPIRGGVIADEVGAGKTTTSLALVAIDLDNQQDGIAFDHTSNDSRVMTEATLILVPSNIIGQWEEEIHRCLPSMTKMTPGQARNDRQCASCPAEGDDNPDNADRGRKYLVIKTMQDLRAAQMSDFVTATVVLATSDLLDNDDYWELVRNVCCAPNVPKTSGRAFDQWLAQVLASLSGLVEASSQCVDMDRFWQEWRKHRGCATKYRRFEGFKRRNLWKQEDDDRKNTKADSMNEIRKISLGAVTEQESHPNALEQSTGVEAVDKDFEMALDAFEADEKIYALFHFFSFRRIMVDEFTYLNSRSLLSIIKLTGECRWILSGTPPLTDYDAINTMAKLIGTKISSSYDEHDGCFAFSKDGAKMTKDKSYVEEFRFYDGGVSGAYKKMLYKKARQFGRLFIRKNPTNLDNVEKFDHYHVVNLSPIQKAIYWEVYQTVMGQSVKFNKKFSAKSLPQMDRQTRIEAAISSSSGPEAALLRCWSELRDHHDTARGTVSAAQRCARIIADKQTSLQTMCVTVLRKMQEAWYYFYKNAGETHQENPHLATYMNNIRHLRFGDISILQVLNCFLWYAEGNRTPPAEMRCNPSQPQTTAGDGASNGHDAGHRLDDMSPRTRKKELATRATELHTLTDQLVTQFWALRFFQVIDKIIAGHPLPPCSFCGEVRETYQESYILGQCGHVECQTCFEDKARQDRFPDGCAEEGCQAAVLSYHLIPASEFVGIPSLRPGILGGSKSQAVVETIRAIDPDDRVLVFVQYNSVRDEFFEACNAAGILYEDGTKDAQRTVERFKKLAQTGSPRPQRKSQDMGKGRGIPHVLVLKIDSPDAAGWNLQCANHVIFVSPLHARSEYEYHSIMTQAVGRSHRARQQKPVHVHHFAAARTIEVNILEKWNKKVMVMRNGDFILVSPSQILPGDIADWSGPSLHGAVSGGMEQDF